MKPAAFDYARPESLSDASALLRRDDKAVAALAGGQSLIVLLSLRVAPVDLLVDIGRLEELKVVRETAEVVFLGASTTHAAIEDGEVPDPSRGLMPRVATNIAYRAVRNHGTIGGSVALCDPAADWPACLAALGAMAVIHGANGPRRESVADLIRGAYETTLVPGEIIVGFDIPRMGENARSSYVKVTRKSGAFASSIAVVVDRGEGADPAVVLAGTSTCAKLLPSIGAALGRAGMPAEDELRSLIAAGITAVDPSADAYQCRTHTATLLRAIREVRAQ